jgi:hypothetical protein
MTMTCSLNRYQRHVAQRSLLFLAILSIRVLSVARLTIQLVPPKPVEKAYPLTDAVTRVVVGLRAFCRVRCDTDGTWGKK